MYAQSVYQSHSKGSIRNPEPVVNNESPKILSDRDITPISKADIQKAESHFGTTKNYDIAGYLLTDGAECHRGRFSLTISMSSDILEADHVCQMVSMPIQPNETEEQKRVNENRPQ